MNLKSEIKLLSDNLYNWSDTNLQGDITRDDCDKIIQWMLGKLPQPDISGRSEQLVDFLLHLNDKELIDNHNFDYEKEAKKYLKKKIN